MHYKTFPTIQCIHKKDHYGQTGRSEKKLISASLLRLHFVTLHASAAAIFEFTKPATVKRSTMRHCVCLSFTVEWYQWYLLIGPQGYERTRCRVALITTCVFFDKTSFRLGSWCCITVTWWYLWLLSGNVPRRIITNRSLHGWFQAEDIF